MPYTKPNLQKRRWTKQWLLSIVCPGFGVIKEKIFVSTLVGLVNETSPKAPQHKAVDCRVLVYVCVCVLVYSTRKGKHDKTKQTQSPLHQIFTFRAEERLRKLENNQPEADQKGCARKLSLAFHAAQLRKQTLRHTRAGEFSNRRSPKTIASSRLKRIRFAIKP